MYYLLYLEIIWRITLFFSVFRLPEIFFVYAAFYIYCGILFKPALECLYFLSVQGYFITSKSSISALRNGLPNRLVPDVTDVMKPPIFTF